MALQLAATQQLTGQRTHMLGLRRPLSAAAAGQARLARSAGLVLAQQKGFGKTTQQPKKQVEVSGVGSQHKWAALGSRTLAGGWVVRRQARGGSGNAPTAAAAASNRPALASAHPSGGAAGAGAA